MFFETKDAWRDKADLRHVQAEFKTTQEALKASETGNDYYLRQEGASTTYDAIESTPELLPTATRA